MTSVAPPPPPPPPIGNGNAAQLTVTLSSQASAQLSKMALESMISGLIKAPVSAKGETVLQTNLGPLSFKAPFVLPSNAQATFKLLQIEPAVQMQLTHINGKPVPPNTPAMRINVLANQLMQSSSNPGLQAGQVKPGMQSGMVSGNATAPATLLNLNTAQGLKAFVLSNNLSTQAPQQGTAQGATPQIQGQTQSTTTGTFNTAAKAGMQTATQGQTAGQSGQANHFQAGNQLNVRLVSVQPPGQTATSTPQTATQVSTSTVITQGVVQGQNAAGQPIIKISQGQIALDTTAKFPEGTQVKLEVLSSVKPTDKPVVTQLAQSTLQQASLAQKWPALEEALTTLRETNPVLADQLMNNVIPKPDSRLAMSMVFFLKALGRGTFKNWPGDQVLRAIARSKPELLKKLEGDFSNLSDKAKHPNSTDWKIAYVPLNDQQKLQQIRIAQRDHREEEQEGKEDPGVRFVIDINLSRLGPMQFDGLAKDSQRKFDLIIRTHAALPGFMRRDIHDIYANGMDVIGFDGKISFQVTPNFVQVDDSTAGAGSINLGMLV